MLTREAALARLREFGTLADTPRRLTLIAPKPRDHELARAVSRVIDMSREAHGQRWMAPAASHTVLP